MGVVQACHLEEVQRLTQALERIKDECGQVCDEYEVCTHRACSSSYKAWAIADAALKGHTLESANEQAIREFRERGGF